MTRPVVSYLLRHNSGGKIGRPRKRQPSTKYSGTGLQTSTTHDPRSLEPSTGEPCQTRTAPSQGNDRGARFRSQISRNKHSPAVPPQDRPNTPQSREVRSDEPSDCSMLLDRSGNGSIPSAKKQKTWSLSWIVNPHSTPVKSGKQSEPARAPSTLIPLNEARSLGSFDKVLERSSPSLRKVYSTYLRQPNPAKLNRSTSQILTIDVNHENGRPQNNSSSPLASEAFVHDRHVSPSRQGRLDFQQAVERPRGTGESSTRFVREHRFTIDEQVELELRSNTSSSSHNDPMGIRMRSAGNSHVSYRREISPVEMTADLCNNRSYPCIASQVASDGYGAERPHASTSEIEERVTQSFLPASLRPHTEKPDAYFANCYDSDSEAWLGFIFPDNMNQSQTEFSFGSAPPICPRDQNEGSPHLIPDNNTRDSLLGQQSSGAFNQSLDTTPNFPTIRNSMIFTPWPTVPCSRPVSQTYTSPAECYFDEQVKNTSMYNHAEDEWASGRLPTEHLWHGIEPCNTLFPNQGQLKFPSKRKASNISESDCLVTAPRGFEPRKKQRSTFEHAPRTMLWETKPGCGSDSENQQFLVALKDVSNDFHVASGRSLEEAGRQSHSPRRQFLKDREVESTKSNVSAAVSEEENHSHEYALPFSPLMVLPNIWANTKSTHHVPLWSAGSNSESVNDCPLMSMDSSH